MHRTLWSIRDFLLTMALEVTMATDCQIQNVSKMYSSNWTTRILQKLWHNTWNATVLELPQLVYRLSYMLAKKRNTVDPRVTTGLTYDQLGLRPKFLFWLTTKSRVTTHASARVASTYPISRAVHCERSWCLLCFAGATLLIPLIKVCTV
jgi:hypothetical protein